MYPVGGPGQQGPGPVGPPGPPQQNPLGQLTGNPGALAGLPGVNPGGLGVNVTPGGLGLGPGLGNHMGQTQITNPAVNPLTTALGTMISPPGQTNLQGTYEQFETKIERQMYRIVLFIKVIFNSDKV